MPEILWTIIFFSGFAIPVSIGIYFDRKAKIYLINMD